MLFSIFSYFLLSFFIIYILIIPFIQSKYCKVPSNATTFAQSCTAWHSDIHSLQNSFIFTKRRNVQMWKNRQQFSALKSSNIVWAVFDVVPAKTSLVAVGSRDTLEMPKMCKRLVKLRWTDALRYTSITCMYPSMCTEPWNSESRKYCSSHLSWFNSHLPWFCALLQMGNGRENSLYYVTHSLKKNKNKNLFSLKMLYCISFVPKKILLAG